MATWASIGNVKHTAEVDPTLSETGWVDLYLETHRFEQVSDEPLNSEGSSNRPALEGKLVMAAERGAP